MISLKNLRDDYVLTPHGHRHTNSVLEIDDGSDVFPSAIPFLGSVPNLRALRPRGPAGWLEAATFTPSQPLGSMSVTFKVPEPPRIRDQSLVYLFPGAEDGAMATILQPVLQWGYNNRFGGEYWSLACWHCDTNGWAYHSKVPVTVEAGDTITGSIVHSNRRADTCDWTISAIVNEGPSKQMTVLGMKRLLLFLTAGALEAYHIETQEPLNGTEVRLLPESGSTKFHDISLSDLRGNSFVADWNKRILASGCAFNIYVSQNRKSVTLEYP